MFINYNNPLKFKNIILFKVKPVKKILLNRITLVSDPYGNESYTFDIQNENKLIISNLENKIIKTLPKNKFLNRLKFDTNLLTVKIPKVKGVIQTERTNLIDNKDKFNWTVNVELYVDQLYSFENNIKNIYFKLKISKIDFICQNTQ